MDERKTTQKAMELLNAVTDTQNILKSQNQQYLQQITNLKQVLHFYFFFFF